MAATFISYRREDAAGYAGRLRESLERRLGPARVFRDVDALRPGQDFVQAIEARLAECQVMLAVIGREWVDARDAAGQRRLDEPYDFVRLEIAAALARREVVVIPVLVEGVSMPAAGQLPENIRPLARRHAVSVRDETWDADVDRLVGVIEGAPAASAGAGTHLPRLSTRALASVAGGLLLLGLVGWLLRGGAEPAGAPPTGANGSPATTAGAADSAAGPNEGPAAATFPPYTIDVPRVAEAAFGDVVYSLVSGNMVSRGATNELRLRFRVANSGRYGVNFWDDTFRLSVNNDVLAPTSGLNEIVEGRSIRLGIITFRLPTRATRAVLQLRGGKTLAEFPLDLSQSGRPALDEQGDAGDGLSSAIFLAVTRDPTPLIDSKELGVTLQRASSRRFANTLRLVLAIRMVNHGRYPVHSGAITMRAAVADEVLAPVEFPNEVLDPMASVSANVVFDLPTTATKIALRTTVGDQTAEMPFELR